MKNIIRVIIGTGLTALAVKCVFDPAYMVTGGFSGIAILIRNLLGISLGTTTFVLNIPVYFIAWKIKGAGFVGWSALATVLLSVWLEVLPSIDISGEDLFLAAVFGGAVCGLGNGIVFSARATTGGSEMIAALLHHRFPQYSIVEILQVIDGMIVLAGLYFFGLKAALYAIIAILVMTKVSDLVMEGGYAAKSVFVISNKCREAADAIMEQMERGVTGLSVKGMYSSKEKCMLYCVVSKREIVSLKEIVLGLDPEAFVIVNDAREVLGEGFRAYHREKGENW